MTDVPVTGLMAVPTPLTGFATAAAFDGIPFDVELTDVEQANDARVLGPTYP